MTVVNADGFEILRDSQTRIEATARFSQNMKYTFIGRLTFEKKITQRYGCQVIIAVWLNEGEYPRLDLTEYDIKRGRIEICVPEIVANRMHLLPRKKLLPIRY